MKKKYGLKASHHMIDQKLDRNLEEIEYKIKQRTFKVSLDELIEFWKFFIPSYLKIDFDGIENMIIRILIKVLKNPKLNSVLIEINRKRKEDLEIISILENSGFKFDQK